MTPSLSRCSRSRTATASPLNEKPRLCPLKCGEKGFWWGLQEGFWGVRGHLLVTCEILSSMLLGSALTVPRPALCFRSVLSFNNFLFLSHFPFSKQFFFHSLFSSGFLKWKSCGRKCVFQETLFPVGRFSKTCVQGHNYSRTRIFIFWKNTFIFWKGLYILKIPV